MNLEKSIQLLERRARLVRLGSYWGLGAIIACILSTLLLQAGGLFQNYSLVRQIWSACGIVALVTTALLTSIYTYKYRPALKSARNELLWATISQLQQQVAELSKKSDS